MVCEYGDKGYVPTGRQFRVVWRYLLPRILRDLFFSVIEEGSRGSSSASTTGTLRLALFVTSESERNIKSAGDLEDDQHLNIADSVLFMKLTAVT